MNSRRNMNFERAIHRLSKAFRRFTVGLVEWKNGNERAEMMTELGIALLALKSSCVYGQQCSWKQPTDRSYPPEFKFMMSSIEEVVILLQNGARNTKGLWRSVVDNSVSVLLSVLESHSVHDEDDPSDQSTPELSALFIGSSGIAAVKALITHLSSVMPVSHDGSSSSTLRGTLGSGSEPKDSKKDFSFAARQGDVNDKSREEALLHSLDQQQSRVTVQAVGFQRAISLVCMLLQKHVQVPEIEKDMLRVHPEIASINGYNSQEERTHIHSTFRPQSGESQPCNRNKELGTQAIDKVLDSDMHKPLLPFLRTPILTDFMHETYVMASGSPLGDSSIAADTPLMTEISSEMRKLCSFIISIPDKLACTQCSWPQSLRHHNLVQLLLSSLVLQHGQQSNRHHKEHLTQQPSSSHLPIDHVMTSLSLNTCAHSDQASPTHQSRVANEEEDQSQNSHSKSHSPLQQLPPAAEAAPIIAALLTSAALRGHAKPCAQLLLDSSSHLLATETSTLPIRSLSDTCTCVAEALSLITEPAVHEYIWSALLRTAARQIESNKPSTWALLKPQATVALFSMLWRNGTARALPNAQHMPLLLSLFSRRTLPPASMVYIILFMIHLDAMPTGHDGNFSNGSRISSEWEQICSTAVNHADVAAISDEPSGFMSFADSVAASWASAAHPRNKGITVSAASSPLSSSKSPHAQAALSFMLLLVLAALGSPYAGSSSFFLQNVLHGISGRLGKGMTDTVMMLQAKRVARTLSALLIPHDSPLHLDKGKSQHSQASKPAEDSPDGLGLEDTLTPLEDPGVLFLDEDLRMMAEEIWWSLPASAAKQSVPTPMNPAVPHVPETDSEDSDAASSASLESDGETDEPRAMDLDSKWRPVQLHQVAAQLRDSQKSVPQMAALDKLEPLVRASPQPEVAKAAPELLRAVIFCKLPDWPFAQHPESSLLHPTYRRTGSMAAILSAAPHAAPESCIKYIFSEHADVSQRLLVLKSLSAAAHELAGKPLLQPLTAPGTNRAHHTAFSASTQPAILGKYNPEKTRIWGHSTLKKLQQDSPDHVNHFAPVALEWAVAVMHGMSQKSQGTSLAMSEPAVFGSLLTTLGAFCSCTRLTMVADTLCGTILDVLLDKSVAENPDAFVRKSALVATSELLRTLPAASVAGAMLRSTSGGRSASIDSALTSKLEKLQLNLRNEAAGSSDETVRALASGCLALQGQLADGALENIKNTPFSSSPAIEVSANIILPPW